MSTRIVAIVLVLAMVAGTLIFTLAGIKPAKTADNNSADSNVAFKLPSGTTEAEAQQSEAPGKIDYSAIPDVIAEIDGVPLKKDIYIRALKSVEKQITASGGLSQDNINQVVKSVLANILNTETLITKAKKVGVSANEEDVAKALEAIKKRFPDEVAYQKQLKDTGLTEKDVKTNIVNNLCVRALLDKEVISKVKVDPAEVKKYYDTNQAQFDKGERVRASHILVKFDPHTTTDKERAAAKAKIEDIQKKLKDGADFAELAKKESDDTGSAVRGGDLGFFQRGAMVPPFETAAFKAKPGEITGIVESQFGYHIIKVFEKKSAGLVPFDEAKKEIETQLKRKLMNTKVRSYVEQVKKELKVKELI